MGKIFYFTSTGNSLYVGKKIKEKIDIDLVSISKIKDEKVVVNEDMIGIIFPLHCFSIPEIVENFIKRLDIKGNPYIFALQVTGGGSFNNGFFTIDKILKSKGLKLNNFTEIKYISNYTRAGKNPTEERAKEAIKREEEKLNRFIEDLIDRKEKNKSVNKQALSMFIHNMWRYKYKNKDKHFNVNSNCISCSMCKKICPVENIDLEDGKPIWKGKCIDCMACINICPEKAINIGTKTEKKNRYKNPYINPNELI